MCLAVPGKILTIEKNRAEVEIMGVLTTVNIQLIDNPSIDDYVLIHAGCAIQRISPEHGQYLQSILYELVPEEEAYEQ